MSRNWQRLFKRGTFRFFWTRLEKGQIPYNVSYNQTGSWGNQTKKKTKIDMAEQNDVYVWWNCPAQCLIKEFIASTQQSTSKLHNNAKQMLGRKNEWVKESRQTEALCHMSCTHLLNLFPFSASLPKHLTYFWDRSTWLCLVRQLPAQTLLSNSQLICPATSYWPPSWSRSVRH